MFHFTMSLLRGAHQFQIYDKNGGKFEILLSNIMIQFGMTLPFTAEKVKFH